MPRKISYQQAITEALVQEMSRDESVIVMGEDNAGGMGAPGEKDAWGGVLGVTKGLYHKFPGRVLDTPISESAFIGAAIGAQLGAPDRPVVCSLGDGAVMYGASGFWTMARYSLPILTIVWNNLNYQTVRTNFAAWGGEMVKQNKYPEALKVANRAVELTQETTQIGTLARRERDRLQQLTGGTAAPAAQPQAEAPKN